LRVKNELTDLAALETHVEALNQIAVYNRLKAEAAMNEDFEAAIAYKKKIAEYEKSLITEELFTE